MFFVLLFNAKSSSQATKLPEMGETSAGEINLQTFILNKLVSIFSVGMLNNYNWLII